jgi:hypothetical protein
MDRRRQILPKARRRAGAVTDQVKARIADRMHVTSHARAGGIDLLRVHSVAKVERVRMVLAKADLAKLALADHPLGPFPVQVIDPFAPFGLDLDLT